MKSARTGVAWGCSKWMFMINLNMLMVMATSGDFYEGISHYRTTPE